MIIFFVKHMSMWLHSGILSLNYVCNFTGQNILRANSLKMEVFLRFLIPIRRLDFSIGRLFCIIFILNFTFQAEAHTPHDLINDVLVVGQPNADSTVFIISSHYMLQASSDAGDSWDHRAWGLDNRYELTNLAGTRLTNGSLALFVSTDGDGVYLSTDGGHRWTLSNTGLDATRIAWVKKVTTPEGDIVFAVPKKGGLYRFDFLQNRWYSTQISSKPVSALGMLTLEGKPTLVSGQQDGSINILSDDGKSWQKWQYITDIGEITWIGDVRHSGEVSGLIGTSLGGIWRWDSIDKSFKSSSEGLEDLNIRDIEPLTNGILLASTWNTGVFRSVDGGRRWVPSRRGLTTDPQADDPRFNAPHFDQLEAITYNKAHSTLLLSGFDGLFRSDDSGLNWYEVETRPTGEFIGLDVSPPSEGSYKVAVTTYGGGAYIASENANDWKVCNLGLQRTRFADTGVVFSPNFAEDLTLFSATDPGQVVVSIDGGEHWKIWMPMRERDLFAKILLKLHHWGFPDSVTIDWVDKINKLPMYLSAVAPSSNFARDNEVFVVGKFHGTDWHVTLSTSNFGESFNLVEEGKGQIFSLVFSPNYAQDGTIFASAREHGLLRSQDRGSSWHALNNGLDYLDDWQRIPEDAWHRRKELSRSSYYNVEITASPAYSVDKTLFAGGGEGLFRSKDGGDSWQRLTISPANTNANILAIEVSPDFSEHPTLLISVKGIGLLRSDDGGENFRLLGEGLIEAGLEPIKIRFAPGYPIDPTIWAISLNTLVVSRDDGLTWKVVERPVRYENLHDADRGRWNVIKYSPDWQDTVGDQFSARGATTTDTAGGEAVFRFVGTGVRWIGARGSNFGIAEVLLDGESVALIDQWAQQDSRRDTLFEIQNLQHGTHLLTIRALHTGRGKLTLVDAFDVFDTRYTSRMNNLVNRNQSHQTH